jgi:signal transduction histidine kinase
LTNVQRHAHAQEVEIELRRTSRNVRLSIRDNGRGFDPSTPVEGHHGIVGMKERAKLLHGRLRIQSSADAGSNIVATVPVRGDA